MQQNSLLPEYQSVYGKHCSCETSLVKLVNDILWGMENQSVTAVVTLDLSAAFNTVVHDLLSVLKSDLELQDQLDNGTIIT